MPVEDLYIKSFVNTLVVRNVGIARNSWLATTV